MLKYSEKGVSLPIVIIIISIISVLISGIVFFIYYFQIKTEPPGTDKTNLIRVENPKAYQEITTPLLMKGEARGFWFFEATFPIKLLDQNGDVLIKHYAQTQGEWMTENFVPFEAQINFSVPETQNGTLVLEKANPSDLPENYDELRIPVILKKSEITYQLVQLYYYNPELDKNESGNILCSRKGLVPVERQIPVTNTPIQDTIRLLITGQLTDAEKIQGIGTEYPLEGFSLKGAALNNGVLTLEFEDLNNKTGGGSCRVGILWFQIEATAKQFPGIQTVRFIPEELFQP